MTQLIFSVYDAKAEAFLAPFVAKTRGLAIRMFSELVNNDGHQFNRFPGDYTLYEIGEWDETNGACNTKPGESLGTGLGYLEQDHTIKAVV